MRLKSVLALLALPAVLALDGASAGAQISDGVVKIGVLTDMSGFAADLAGPGSVLAGRMAVEEWGGKVAGMPIEFVFADSQNKPDVGSGIVRAWFDRDKVDAVADVPVSPVALAVNAITRERNKVFLGSSVGTADLTGPACSPNTVHWTYDTWSIANGTGKAVVQNGGKTWFFLTADNAFGHALQRDVTQVVEKAGGKVVGAVRHPVNVGDLSSFLLQAQASKAEIIALANSGADTVNSIKQGVEFGLARAGQRLLALNLEVINVHSVGLDLSQGLLLTGAFYWDLNERTREWSKRFAQRNKGQMPTMYQAGVYGSIMHYLKAVAAAGTDDGRAVVAKMKALPTDDVLFGKGVVRADGRKIHDMYLFEVKAPKASKGIWDYYTVVRSLPGTEAFRPLEQGGCPLVK